MSASSKWVSCCYLSYLLFHDRKKNYHREAENNFLTSVKSWLHQSEWQNSRRLQILSTHYPLKISILMFGCELFSFLYWVHICAFVKVTWEHLNFPVLGELILNLSIIWDMKIEIKKIKNRVLKPEKKLRDRYERHF